MKKSMYMLITVTLNFAYWKWFLCLNIIVHSFLEQE